MAFDSGLAQRVREILADRTGITERSMFGGLAFLLNGSMFVGLADTDLMARVGPDRYLDALALPKVRPIRRCCRLEASFVRTLSLPMGSGSTFST